MRFQAALGTEKQPENIIWQCPEKGAQSEFYFSDVYANDKH